MGIVGSADVPDRDACAARASNSRQLGRTAAHTGIRGNAGSPSGRWRHSDTQAASIPRDCMLDAHRHGRRRAPCTRLHEHRTRVGGVRIGMGVLAGGCRRHWHPLRDAGVVRKASDDRGSNREDALVRRRRPYVACASARGSHATWTLTSLPQHVDDAVTSPPKRRTETAEGSPCRSPQVLFGC